MPLNLASDLDLMMADLGVTVICAGVTGKAQLMVATEDHTMDGDFVVAGESRFILYRIAKFPGITRDASLTVGGVSYTVRDTKVQDDGLLGRAWLKVA